MAPLGDDEDRVRFLNEARAAALSYALQIAEGLGEAHGKDVVHRRSSRRNRSPSGDRV